MTLAFAGVVSLSNIQDMCNYEGTDDIVIARTNSSNGIIAVYDAATRTQVGSNIDTTNNPCGVAMIAATHCAVFTTGSGHQIVNLSGGTVNGFSSLASGTTGKQQQVAGLPSQGVGFAVSTTEGRLVKFTTSPSLTAANVDPHWLTRQRGISIIAKPDTNSFIVATNNGQIIEMDTSANVIRQYYIPRGKFVFARPDSSITPWPLATGMYYNNGYLVVATNAGFIITFDHESGIELNRIGIQCTSDSIVGQSIAGSGPTLLVGSFVVNTNGVVGELDVFLDPPKWNGYYFGPASFTQLRIIGITGSIVYVASNISGTLHFLNLTGARSISFLDVDFEVDSNPEAGKFVVLDESASPSEVMFATTIPASGKQVPVTTGSDILKLAQIGIGDDALFEVRRD